ncbi:MAG: hypothetical protein ACYC6Q_05295 [Syntrophales bacterium]
MKIMKIKFGKSGDNVDAFGMRFYGDIDDEGRQLGRVSEIFSDSDGAGNIKNKRITLWFTFEKIRSYEKASNLLDDLVAGLRKEGYEIIFSSIDDLVDTNSLEYRGTPESCFPASRRIHGYNAAGGFSASAEKRDSKKGFMLEEIEAIQTFAKKFGRIAYGKSLMKSI